MDSLFKIKNIREDREQWERFSQDELKTAHYYHGRTCEAVMVITGAFLIANLILSTATPTRTIIYSSFFILGLVSRFAPLKGFHVTRILVYIGLNILAIAYLSSDVGLNMVFPPIIMYFVLVVLWIFVIRDFRMNLILVSLSTISMNAAIFLAHPDLDGLSSGRSWFLLVQNSALISVLCISLIKAFEKERFLTFKAVNSAKMVSRNINELINKMPVGIAVCDRFDLLHTNSAFACYADRNSTRNTFQVDGEEGEELSFTTKSSSPKGRVDDEGHRKEKRLEALENFFFLDEEDHLTELSLQSLLFGTEDGSIKSEYYEGVIHSRSLGKYSLRPGSTVEEDCFESMTQAASPQRTKVFEVTLTRCTWFGQDAFLLIFQDITLLEMAFIRVKELDSLKSRWLRTVSHELKTPLNGVMGVFHFLKQRDSSGSSHELIKTGSHAAQTLLMYISDLLDYFQLQAGSFKISPRNFDLYEVIRRVTELMKLRSSDKNIEITVVADQPDKKFFLVNDSHRLEQILLNLLSNAVKFSPEGGKISIKVGMAATGAVTIKVRDSGIGIKEEDIGKLFGEFHRIVNPETIRLNPQGNGLGLWISRRLAQAMGGNLEVISDYGSGSEFIISISRVIHHGQEGAAVTTPTSNTPHVSTQRSEKQAMTPTRQMKRTASVRHNLGTVPSMNRSFESFVDAEDSITVHVMDVLLPKFNFSVTKGSIPTAGRRRPSQSLINMSTVKTEENARRRVLVVDDEALNRLILGSFLEAKGLAFDVAKNGEEALEILKAGKETSSYSLIIMDYQMPKMDGPECCKAIKCLEDDGHLREQTIIGHTAYCSEEDLNYFKSCGADDILLKPITEDSLDEILERWLF